MPFCCLLHRENITQFPSFCKRRHRSIKMLTPSPKLLKIRYKKNVKISKFEAQNSKTKQIIFEALLGVLICGSASSSEITNYFQIVCFFCAFLFFCPAMQPVGSQFPHQGWNAGPGSEVTKSQSLGHHEFPFPCISKQISHYRFRSGA